MVIRLPQLLRREGPSFCWRIWSMTQAREEMGARNVPSTCATRASLLGSSPEALELFDGQDGALYEAAL